METRVSLKYFLSYCLLKHFFDSNLAQAPSNLTSLKLLVTLMLLVLFEPYIIAVKWQKNPKICRTWILLSRSFHWGYNLLLKELEVCVRTFFRKKNKILVEIWPLLTNLVVKKSIISIIIKHKKSFAENRFRNLLRLLDDLPNFIWPQVKRWVSTTYKHGIYELPHELPNHLRLEILKD